MDTCSLAPGPRGSATCAVSVRALAMPRAGWHVNSGSGCRRFPVNCQCQWALSRAAALAPDLPDPAPALAGDAAVPAACGAEQVDTAHSAEDPARGPERGRTAVLLSSCLSGDAPAAGTAVAGRCCNIAGHNLNRHGVDSSRAPRAQIPAGFKFAQWGLLSARGAHERHSRRPADTGSHAGQSLTGGSATKREPELMDAR